MCTAFVTIPSPTTLRAPAAAFARYPSARRVSCLAAGPSFAIHSQARRPRPAESSSSSYGLVVHLLLLPTLLRSSAVTVGYRPESAYLERTCTALTMHTLRRTSAEAAPLLKRGDLKG